MTSITLNFYLHFQYNSQIILRYNYQLMDSVGVIIVLKSIIDIIIALISFISHDNTFLVKSKNIQMRVLDFFLQKGVRIKEIETLF